MKGRDVVFSSGKDDWCTPSDLFAALNAEFHFTVDAAANERNHLCERWYGPGSILRYGWSHKEVCVDALACSWLSERCWLNPPYSQVAKFVAKAAGESALTVMLIPSRTDTRYWHNHIWDREKHQPREGVQVRFIKGRLKFSGSKQSAPFPSAIVVFGG